MVRIGRGLENDPIVHITDKGVQEHQSSTGPEECHPSLASIWTLALFCGLLFNENTPSGGCLLQICIYKASIFFNGWFYKPSELQLFVCKKMILKIMLRQRP